MLSNSNLSPVTALFCNFIFLDPDTAQHISDETEQAKMNKKEVLTAMGTAVQSLTGALRHCTLTRVGTGKFGGVGGIKAREMTRREGGWSVKLDCIA